MRLYHASINGDCVAPVGSINVSRTSRTTRRQLTAYDRGLCSPPWFLGWLGRAQRSLWILIFHKDVGYVIRETGMHTHKHKHKHTHHSTYDSAIYCKHFVLIMQPGQSRGSENDDTGEYCLPHELQEPKRNAWLIPKSETRSISVHPLAPPWTQKRSPVP